MVKINPTVDKVMMTAAQVFLGVLISTHSVKFSLGISFLLGSELHGEITTNTITHSKANSVSFWLISGRLLFKRLPLTSPRHFLNSEGKSLFPCRNTK